VAPEPKKEDQQQQDPPPAGDTLVIEGLIEPPDPPKPPEPNGDKPGRTFSVEDIEKARREEKDKLYSEIGGLKDELKAIKAEREKANKLAEEAAAKEAANQAKAAAEAKAKQEEEMSVKDLLAQKESEWEARLRQIEEERTRDQELLAKERRFNELVSYRQRRLEEEQDTIAPQLRDLVILGNTEADIEASIQMLQDKTNQILEQMSVVQQQHRQQQRGTTATAPPVGPLESQPEFQSLSNDDLKNMDIATYAKNRDRLLGAVSQRVRSQGPYGG
jgi:DNA repair exonuclease SbcCD ATPase subunit